MRLTKRRMKWIALAPLYLALLVVATIGFVSEMVMEETADWADR